MQVKDLKLEEEVLPFFDYTNSKYAADRLLSLLHEIPATEAEVLEKQTIIKGFLDNWAILENFTYRKLDLMEVHASLGAIANEYSAGGEGRLKFYLKLMLSETERNRLRSRLVQIVLLLRSIYVQYLARLNKDKFPESFQKQLRNALTFLSKLDLNSHAEHINENRFTVLRIVAFAQRLIRLNPEEIKHFWDFFFFFEAYWSIAKGTLVKSFTFPSFSNGNFKIAGFYHPILTNPVKNTLEMDEDQNVLLLTGPNMSGKSTLLKAVSLCVYLARTGFTVPASHCIIPFFSSIAIAVNLSDNLRDGYSHFMSEIANLKSVVLATESSGKCFAVFDEIFRGTNVDDALDITQTTVNGLARIKKSFFLISTHMLQLDGQLGCDPNMRIKKCYIECILDNGSPKFSYHLKEGWSQLKIGKILFEKEGLSELLRAKDILSKSNHT